MKFKDLSIGDVFLYNSDIVCHKSSDNAAVDQWHTTYHMVNDDKVKPVLLADGSILKNNQVVYFNDCGVTRRFTPHHVNYKKPLFELVGFGGNNTIYRYTNACYSSEVTLEISHIKYVLRSTSGLQLDIFGNVSIQGDSVNIFSLKERLQLLKQGGE